MAKLNVQMTCIKYVLFSASFTFVLLGVMAIVGGSALLTTYSNFESFLEAHHFKPAQILIAVGVLIFFVSVVGCIGAIKQSTMLVNLYAFMLFLLLILEIAGGIAAFVMRSGIVYEVKENMEESLKDYKKSDSSRHAWDFTQEHMHCCGVEYPVDWAPELVDGPLVTIEGKTFTVPSSCCKGDPHVCVDIYREGCLTAMEGYVINSASKIGFGVLTIFVIQLLGVIIAFGLAKAIRRVKTQQEMERQQTVHSDFEYNIGRQGLRANRDSLFISPPSSTDA